MFIGKHAAQRKHASRNFDFLIVNSVMLKRYRNKAPRSLKGEIIKGERVMSSRYPNTFLRNVI